MKFDELNIEEALLEGLRAMNFKETTPVQEKTIPIILEGKDIIACAQTGTGKTAAYLLPILNMLCKNDTKQDVTKALIMVPTRELAQQIDQQLEGFAYFLPVSSVAIYGGGDGAVFEQQKRALLSGVDIAIATPGRLLALIAMGEIDLSDVKFFILDEADRMLEMGFVEDIMQVASYLSKDKQTLLFSATMPAKIRDLAKKILKNPEEIKLAVSKPADKIQQSAYICYETQKVPIILDYFKQNNHEKIIVFSSSKQKVKDLASSLKSKGLSVAAMHSDLEQGEREEVIRKFKHGHINILIATDIVSRGIDIEDIELVVNFDVPRDVEDYIHRIGRTARANADGKAMTFVSENDQWRFKKIENFIEKEIDKELIPETFGETPKYNPTEHKTEPHKKHWGKSKNNTRNTKRQTANGKK
jgi:superfamily II DNA/RNA helicase